MQLKHWMFIALGFLLALIPTAGEGTCVYSSDMEKELPSDWETPFRMVYEGPYDRSTQGMTATAHLDDERVARYLTLVIHGERGRTDAVVRFESEADYTIGVETHDYGRSIYEGDPATIEPRLEARQCLVYRGHEIVSTSSESDPDGAASWPAEVRHILEDYLPCPLRFPASPPPPPSGPGRP